MMDINDVGQLVIVIGYLIAFGFGVIAGQQR